MREYSIKYFFGNGRSTCLSIFTLINNAYSLRFNLNIVLEENFRFKINVVYNFNATFINKILLFIFSLVEIWLDV